MQPPVTRAFLLATKIHASQQRKASIVAGRPYLSHLMEVAGMVMANGGNENAVAAALLHDAIEDQGDEMRQVIREQMGEEVLALVEECTEPGTGGAHKAPWQERKDVALARLRTMSLSAALIMLCDKLQNARELDRFVRIKGDKAYSFFRAGKQNTLWFHREVALAIQYRIDTYRQSHPDEAILLTMQCLQQEFQDVVDALERR
jgi:(p)ppGpp synthase/HD superfamily hydrolase